ncbi:MAG: CRTAC1 family protein [Isosphaera sp.]|nr:CRTAC1 family protein [Isosphaera sp.]
MFTDVSGLIAHNPPALHGGVAVADLFGDGAAALVVAGFGGPNRVLRWSAGRVRDVVVPDLADIARHAVAAAAGDLDGDGREELYVVNADPPAGGRAAADRLFDPQPDGRWEDLFSRPENRAARTPRAGRSVAAVDRRGVGRYGFFVAGGGPARLVEQRPDGGLVDLAPALELDRAAGGWGVLALPVLSDHPDLLCVNDHVPHFHGPNFAFRNRGDGTFAEVAAELGLCDPGEHGRGVAACDAGDGGFALCWGNWDGPHRLMVCGPGGAWKDRATPGLAFPSAVRAVVAADFDNDGHDELFFLNVGEPNRLFRVSPELTMLDPGEGLDPGGYGTGAAVCDVDGDGVLELVVARGERAAQPLGLFKARGAEGNGWLRVRPLTRFGAPARGSVVRAEAGGRVRVKGVGQAEPVAHFGFGPGGRAERVRVTWPDGAAVVLLNPGENRTVTVPYPRG